jgi:hypothetical protein
MMSEMSQGRSHQILCPGGKVANKLSAFAGWRTLIRECNQRMTVLCCGNMWTPFSLSDSAVGAHIMGE